jgi:hypothetical protein
MELKLSVFNAEILEVDSCDLHYSIQDWSLVKLTPENIEQDIKLQNVYFVITLC